MAKAPDSVASDTVGATTAAGAKAPVGDPVLEGVKKGDWVRLLEPHFDGFQRLEAGTVVQWWNDDPPNARNVARVEDEQTPLTAPAMTDGKPPESYRDPKTGKPPVVTSV